MQSTEREYSPLALRNAKSKLNASPSSDPQNEELWRESANEIPGPTSCDEIVREGRRQSATDVPVILRPWPGAMEAWCGSQERSCRSVNAFACAIELELQTANPNTPCAPLDDRFHARPVASNLAPLSPCAVVSLGNLRSPFHLSHTLIIIFIPCIHWAAD